MDGRGRACLTLLVGNGMIGVRNKSSAHTVWYAVSEQPDLRYKSVESVLGGIDDGDRVFKLDDADGSWDDTGMDARDFLYGYRHSTVIWEEIPQQAGDRSVYKFGEDDDAIQVMVPAVIGTDVIGVARDGKTVWYTYMEK